MELRRFSLVADSLLSALTLLVWQRAGHLAYQNVPFTIKGFIFGNSCTEKIKRAAG